MWFLLTEVFSLLDDVSFLQSYFCGIPALADSHTSGRDYDFD